MDHSDDHAQRMLPRSSMTCQLALGARLGEPGRFDELYARISPSILAWARMSKHAHLRASMDPDDFVQDVWIRATRSFEQFDPSRGTFRQWIFKIAKHMSIDLLRRWGREEARGDPRAVGGSSMHALGDKTTGDPSTWRTVARGEALEAFIRRVGELSSEDQSLFMHCGIEELTLTQVAERLEITEAATRKRWQRLRARLVEEGIPDGVID